MGTSFSLAKAGMIDRTANMPTFVGKKRTLLISPFAVRITCYSALYDESGRSQKRCGPTGFSMASQPSGQTDSEPSAEGKVPRTTADSAGDETKSEDSLSTIEETESPVAGVTDISKRDMLRKRKQVVFEFDVNMPSLSRTWR